MRLLCYETQYVSTAFPLRETQCDYVSTTFPRRRRHEWSLYRISFEGDAMRLRLYRIFSEGDAIRLRLYHIFSEGDAMNGVPTCVVALWFLNRGSYFTLMR